MVHEPNKQSVNQVHMIGNAHLDPVWLWTWQEGYAEIKATFRSALDRMKEFPEYMFTCAGAAYYKWVEENAPEMFEEIRQRVAEGRWVVVGGWWIQPDCNLPSGESFARHSLYSQRYYLERFGKMTTTGYNVDSFGHHAMIPQILRLSGMDSYVFMRPMKHEKQLDTNLFWWESTDGSRVMTFRIPFSYTTRPHTDNESKVMDTKRLMNEQGTDFMCFYGIGNHGGGPTIENLREIRALQEKLGAEAVVHSSPDSYFSRVREAGHTLPIVQDELQHHAKGCYSTHSESKALNRKAEHRLLAAEKFSALAHRLLGLPYAGEELAKAWQNVMFNQFHDIMGGCSIKEAFDDARESYGHALQIGAVSLNAALQKISWSIDTMKEGLIAWDHSKDNWLGEHEDYGVPAVIFNPLSWEVTAPVQLPRKVRSVTDETDTPATIQHVRASRTDGNEKHDTLIMATIPPLGYRVYWMYLTKEYELPNVEESLTATATTLENRYVRLELEPHTGYVKSLFDKRSGIEAIAGRGAVPVVVDEYFSDTWGHGVLSYRDEIGRFADAEVKVVESGPVRARLRVTSRYGNSILRQDFMLHKDCPVIQVKVQLDWREKHKMLKLSYPVRVNDPQATFEIPYGHLIRPVNGEESPGQQWLDLAGTVPEDGRPYGLAMLNSGKYSFDVMDNDMRMTLVRGAIFADHYGVRDDLCEFMDQGIQEFAYALVPHEGGWQDAGVVKLANELNSPPVHIMETYHKGSLPQKYAGLHISADNVIATVFKKAEDGDGYIVRCYETAGRAVEAQLSMPDLNRAWSADFGKCEIKTFKIPANPGEPVTETNLLEL